MEDLEVLEVFLLEGVFGGGWADEEAAFVGLEIFLDFLDLGDGELGRVGRAGQGQEVHPPLFLGGAAPGLDLPERRKGRGVGDLGGFEEPFSVLRPEGLEGKIVEDVVGDDEHPAVGAGKAGLDEALIEGRAERKIPVFGRSQGPEIFRHLELELPPAGDREDGGAGPRYGDAVGALLAEDVGEDDGVLIDEGALGLVQGDDLRILQAGESGIFGAEVGLQLFVLLLQGADRFFGLGSPGGVLGEGDQLLVGLGEAGVDVLFPVEKSLVGLAREDSRDFEAVEESPGAGPLVVVEFLGVETARLGAALLPDEDAEDVLVGLQPLVVAQEAGLQLLAVDRRAGLLDDGDGFLVVVAGPGQVPLPQVRVRKLQERLPEDLVVGDVPGQGDRLPEVFRGRLVVPLEAEDDADVVQDGALAFDVFAGQGEVEGLAVIADRGGIVAEVGMGGGDVVQDADPGPGVRSLAQEVEAFLEIGEGAFELLAVVRELALLAVGRADVVQVDEDEGGRAGGLVDLEGPREMGQGLVEIAQDLVEDPEVGQAVALGLGVAGLFGEGQGLLVGFPGAGEIVDLRVVEPDVVEADALVPEEIQLPGRGEGRLVEGVEGFEVPRFPMDEALLAEGFDLEFALADFAGEADGLVEEGDGFLEIAGGAGVFSLIVELDDGDGFFDFGAEGRGVGREAEGGAELGQGIGGLSQVPVEEAEEGEELGFIGGREARSPDGEVFVEGRRGGLEFAALAEILELPNFLPVPCVGFRGKPGALRQDGGGKKKY